MLKPKWLGLLAVLVAIMVSFTVLGLWQLSVARDDALKAEAQSAANRPVVPLTSVIEPHRPVHGRPVRAAVTATGRYDAAGQVLVVDRRLDDVGGSWVVCAARRRRDRRSPRRTARVPARGPHHPGVRPGPCPRRHGDRRGALAPAESPTTTSTPLADGPLASVDLARLVNELDDSRSTTRSPSPPPRPLTRRAALSPGCRRRPFRPA